MLNQVPGNAMHDAMMTGDKHAFLVAFVIVCRDAYGGCFGMSPSWHMLIAVAHSAIFPEHYHLHAHTALTMSFSVLM